MSVDEKHEAVEEAARIFAAKEEWHRKQAALPIKEKMRIMLELQKQDYPFLKARGVLRSWEKPWDCEA